MSIFEGLLQGIIQGLTEFLPVSSSGHLVLFQHFFGLSGSSSMFFNLMLHLGTLAAVIAAYYEDLWAMIKELAFMVKEVFTGKFHLKTENLHRQLLYMLFLATLPLVLVLPIKKYVSTITSDSDIIIEGACFILTALILFAGCKAKRGKASIRTMKAKHALAIGVLQGIAVFPGISRSGSTISTGLVLGFDRAFMVKFSFLLGIPAIIGGALSEISAAAADKHEIAFAPLVAGMLAAAIFGYVCIRLVRWLLLSDKFILFAWYTLVLGTAVILVGIVQRITGIGLSPASASSALNALSGAAPSAAYSFIPESAATLLSSVITN